ncbi:MAG: dienelactone hydrolase family protein, partial [Anaeromyxobacteraceae bacterium]
MNLKIRTAAVLALAALALPAAAAVKTKPLEYKQGDTVLQGFLAWDDAAKGKRPGVLVVHEWWGQNEHARQQARRLAQA